MSRFPRAWSFGFAALMAAAALAAPGTPAAGDPETPALATTEASTVTLVTGDVVRVTTLAGGAQTAEITRPDGATGGVRLQQLDDDLYVLPDEAVPLIDAGRLDRRLFDVSDLIEMGYDDAHTVEVPLIAAYAPTPAALTAGKASTDTSRGAPKGSRLVRQLPSVSGAALAAPKSQTRAFWTAIAGDGVLKGGLAKVWLDGRVQADLKESVPQIGAPTAWAAGYDGKGVKVAVLDTGVDVTHPDLAGQIDEKVSFVPGEDTSDVNGHGTHVVSTIVGTGAASGGVYKGVAPGADLIFGKVLGGAEGFGQDSWVIAGMQWAAESGADVVSMSLGDSLPSDGSDPMSMAVNTLTEQYGSLFVIASGNAGPETIAAPGAAAAALTVGAVDKKDRLASFSSTGPLTITGAIKPDISAPGVDITAARSQQMTSGSGWYRTISGTSMATPHVAGAAAILAQRHPDWSAARLKDALMSSSKGLAYSPYQVGTGRVDVAAAITRTVQATGSVFLDNFTWPHESSDAPVGKPVTFTNSGDTDVTLTLAIAGTTPYSISSPSVTVPAGGSASVTVTGDPQAAGVGTTNGAYLVGTDASTGIAVTRTSLALLKEAERYDLKLKVIGRDGRPVSSYVVLNKAGGTSPGSYLVDGERTLRLAPGTYTAETYLDVPGEAPDRLGKVLMVAPEVSLTASAEVVLDARTARLVDAHAPQQTANRQRRLDYQVRYGEGGQFRESFLTAATVDDLYLTPTPATSRAAFTLATRWRQGEPQVTLAASGVPGIEATIQSGSTLSASQANLPILYAHRGASADYAGLDVTGKAAIVDRTDAVTPAARVAAAAAAGAKLLVVVNDGVGNLNESVGASPIPVVVVHRDTGAALIRLAEAGTLRLNVKLTPYASYVYDLLRTYAGQVPDRDLTYAPTQDELARIDARYHAVADVLGQGFRYDMTFTPSAGLEEREYYPGTRTEWVTPAVTWHEGHTQAGVWEDRANLNAYAQGTRTVLDWFKPAVHPSFGQGFSVRNARTVDRMTFNVQAWTASGEVIDHGGTLGGTVPESLKLYQGDTLIRQSSSSALQNVTVPSGVRAFRLVHDASRPADIWRLSTRTHTEWSFTSGTTTANTPLALPELDYDLPADLHGDVNAGSTQHIRLEAGPQLGGGVDGGPVTTVTLQVSYDDGATWTPVTLTQRSGGWEGDLKLPKQAGFVSLRTAATTADGWTVAQDVIRAYGVR
ncbi:MAG: S8 family serine peptidase [Hamadaea sp.]|uniref:S8 family serine peptidase n=1 Tax=Hamadaea sp. TaxID=2024425 RepID=UPI0017B57179|nr:S8 family serine peptidase [Hamadaea sp.]NUT18683.1 S8 family serine peptidase [Hamadaea sp.]